MKTEVIKIDQNNMDTEALERAAAIIRDGGLVAFPTETVYGLGADALSAEASKKIYAAKGRPSDNPLIVHVAEFSDMEKIAQEMPEEAKKLADAFCARMIRFHMKLQGGWIRWQSACQITRLHWN